MVFINKMDRENADFDKALDSTLNVLSKKCAPLQMPIGSQQSFRGIVDLLQMKAYVYKPGDTSGKYEETGIPDEVAASAQRHRESLIERIAESDDDLTMKYLEGEELTYDELVAGLKAGIRSGTLVPVLCGAGAANIGVSQLLDALAWFSPS